MDNPQALKNHYVYVCSDNKRIYIGKRSCRCPIEEDTYIGSFTDNSFKPFWFC